MGFYQKMAADRAAGKLGTPPKYRVLQVDMLKQADREKAATIISFVQSDSDAYKLAGHDGFAYKDLDLRRRVGVVTYKGAEVALLFKREVLELEPGPADPVPERTIKDPVGAWIQVDLLNADAVEIRKGIGDRLSAAIAQAQRLQMLWQDEKGRREKLEEEVASRQGLKEALRGSTEKIALMEAEKKATEKEMEGLKRDLQKEKEARRNDKLNLVREMFPVFNTVWLAGLHRVGDQLYGIIRTQLTEALGKIGIKFVEPKVGDTFDPNSHHAIHGQPYPMGAREIGSVIQVHRVGWSLGSAVIEAADVSVGVESKEEVKDGTGQCGSPETEPRGEAKADRGVA
jgi:molecular chaperone GrpE